MKIFATVLAVLAVFLTLVSVFSAPILFRTFSLQTYRRMKLAAQKINDRSPGSVTYYFDLNSIASEDNVFFEIINADGVLAYSSSADGSAQGSGHFASSVSSEPEYNDLLPFDERRLPKRRNGFEVRKKTASNVKFFVYSSLLDSGETLRVYSKVADVENVVRVAGRVYSLITVSLIIITALIFYLVVAEFTRPLVEMNDVTKKMAALDFDRKCGYHGNDEIGELCENVNALSVALKSALMDLNDKNLQLEKDIEKRLALDAARKSFINNVSHELKTPIAIISGYAEGLCEKISDDPAVINDYYRIIYDESRKMNALVVDLLELSKLESGAQPFEPAYFNVGATISYLVDRFSLLFEKNSVTVRNNVPEKLVCYAQEDKIEIVLKNYITNAVAHCSEDGIIEICAEERGRFIEISVFNSGERISERDLPEIWDSFYRADKAHDRSKNRFGLGLSIVKSVMTAHRCKYGVENVENGVLFTFEVAKDSSYYDEKQ